MSDPEHDASADDESGLAWDQDFADALIGATLLVDVTHLEHDGTLVRHERIVGRVQAADAEDGITLIRNDTGEPFIVAPILEAIEPGSAGSDRFSGQDAGMEDPDYMVVFSVTAPLRH